MNNFSDLTHLKTLILKYTSGYNNDTLIFNLLLYKFDIHVIKIHILLNMTLHLIKSN